MDSSLPDPSVGFSRQEHWSGLPFPTPGDLPDPGIQPMSLASPALTGRFLPLSHLGSPNIPPGPHKYFLLTKKIFISAFRQQILVENLLYDRSSPSVQIEPITKTVTSWTLYSSGETQNEGSIGIFFENMFLWWWCLFSKTDFFCCEKIIATIN